MIYDFKREKDMRKLKTTNPHLGNEYLTALLETRDATEKLMREFVGPPDEPVEPGCGLIIGPHFNKPIPIREWSVTPGSVLVNGKSCMDAGSILHCRDGLFRFTDGEVAMDRKTAKASLKARWE